MSQTLSKTLIEAASKLPEQMKCRNCGREVYPSLDRGVVSWTHKYSQSDPTRCKADPFKNPLIQA